MDNERREGEREREQLAALCVVFLVVAARGVGRLLLVAGHIVDNVVRLGHVEVVEDVDEDAHDGQTHQLQSKSHTLMINKKMRFFTNTTLKKNLVYIAQYDTNGILTVLY